MEDPDDRVWSIPAWAGETALCCALHTHNTVDPRVGGGDDVHRPQRARTSGRSPSGRGRRAEEAALHGVDRSIPAWAGETTRARGARRRGSVDPRVGGGDGTMIDHDGKITCRSPRGRGRRQDVGKGGDQEGSIPAWAGETALIAEAASHPSVDPRVGGGDSMAQGAAIRETGRSPRGRGRLAVLRKLRESKGSIPAWAGETPTTCGGTPMLVVDPRVGGGDSGCRRAVLGTHGRSPRGRGRLVFRVSA